jgi:hypothetical protein
MNPEKTPTNPNEDAQQKHFFRRLRSSALALVMANLMPLYGVLALGWKVAPILVFYWTENLVVGFINVLKMARAKGAVNAPNMTMNGRPVTQDSRKGLIIFFIFHYGGFTLGHGVFVMTLFHPERQSLPGEIILALLVLCISHGYSYQRNFIRSGEYLQASFARLFWQPYVRVVVMHITILAGGALAQSMGSPLGALLVLVALKTLIDLGGHWLEHKKFSVRFGGGPCGTIGSRST